MKYSFNICHIPGKDLIFADTLSRAQLRKSPTKTDIRLNEDLNLYVANILEGLPATERRLDEIRLHQQGDEVHVPKTTGSQHRGMAWEDKT